MRLLLDTHALIWWFGGGQRLSSRALEALEDQGNDVIVSAASGWEIATKYRARRLPDAAGLAEDIAGHMARENFQELPISMGDAVQAASLPEVHRDPFDRILIAQALSRDLTLVSIEPLFDRYDVRRLW